MDWSTSHLLEQLHISPELKEFLSGQLSSNPVQQKYFSRPDLDSELHNLLLGKDQTGFLVGISIRLFLFCPDQHRSLPVQDSFSMRLAMHHAISGSQSSAPDIMMAAILGWLGRKIAEGRDCRFSPASIQLAEHCLKLIPVPTLYRAPDFLSAYCESRSVGECHEEALQKILGYGFYTAFVLDDLLGPLKRTSMILDSMYLYNYCIICDIFIDTGKILGGLKNRWSLALDPLIVRLVESLVSACGRCDMIHSQAKAVSDKGLTQLLPALRHSVKLLVRLIENAFRALHDHMSLRRPFSFAGQDDSASNFHYYTGQLSLKVSELQLRGWRPDYAEFTNNNRKGDELSAAGCSDNLSGSLSDVEARTGQSLRSQGSTDEDNNLPQPEEGFCFKGTYPALIHKCLFHAPGRTLKVPELYAWFQKHTSKSEEPKLEQGICKALSASPDFERHKEMLNGESVSLWSLTDMSKGRKRKRGAHLVTLQSRR